VKLKKYEFWLLPVAFLGDVINHQDNLVDPSKVSRIID
jgi:hypothetical protein